MINTISIGTGLVYKFHEDQNDRIKRIRKDFGHEGVELCIADADYLMRFSPTPQTIEYLKSLDYVTIHAPWLNVRYGDNDSSRAILMKIEELYHLIGAKNVTVENSEIDDISVFGRYDFQISIENDDWRKETNTPQKIAKILDNNPNFRFTFDFAHALTIGESEMMEFIDRFKYKISQIHMSNLSRDLKDHNFLHRDGSPESYRLLRYVKDNLDVPLVLECVATDEEEIDLIGNEIDFLKRF